jgi:fructokinase
MRIGIDLGGTKIEGIALAAGGGIVARRRLPTPREDYEGTLSALVNLVHGLEREAAETGTVGIGTPGAVSPATGRIKNANSTWLNGRPLGFDLETRLGRPVRLANDANCFALSEAVDGAAADARTVFGVIVGTGTGGGLVVNRRLEIGKNAIAGEWGHNPLPWPSEDEQDGRPCYCGKRGCVETFLSGPGWSEDHARRHGESLAPETIAERAASGDPACGDSVERYTDRMARALAMVINVVDPDAIVLGGGMSRLDALYARVPEGWGRYVFSDRVDTALRPARHGDASGVRGAAWLWPEPAGGSG